MKKLLIILSLIAGCGKADKRLYVPESLPSAGWDIGEQPVILDDNNDSEITEIIIIPTAIRWEYSGGPSYLEGYPSEDMIHQTGFTVYGKTHKNSQDSILYETKIISITEDIKEKQNVYNFGKPVIKKIEEKTYVRGNKTVRLAFEYWGFQHNMMMEILDRINYIIDNQIDEYILITIYNEDNTIQYDGRERFVEKGTVKSIEFDFNKDEAMNEINFDSLTIKEVEIPQLIPKSIPFPESDSTFIDFRK